jgi:hypothetical protein
MAATSYGNVRVKEILSPDGSMLIAPEYEDCRKIALEHGIPLRVVYDTIARETSG